MAADWHPIPEELLSNVRRVVERMALPPRKGVAETQFVLQAHGKASVPVIRITQAKGNGPWTTCTENDLVYYRPGVATGQDIFYQVRLNGGNLERYGPPFSSGD